MAPPADLVPHVPAPIRDPDFGLQIAKALSFADLPQVPQRGALAAWWCKDVDDAARRARLREIELKTAAVKELTDKLFEERRREEARRDQYRKAAFQEQRRQTALQEQKRQAALQEQRRQAELHEQRRKTEMLEKIRQQVLQTERRNADIAEKVRKQVLQAQQRNADAAQKSHKEVTAIPTMASESTKRQDVRHNPEDKLMKLEDERVHGQRDLEANRLLKGFELVRHIIDVPLRRVMYGIYLSVNLAWKVIGLYLRRHVPGSLVEIAKKGSLVEIAKKAYFMDTCTTRKVLPREKTLRKEEKKREKKETTEKSIVREKGKEPSNEDLEAIKSIPTFSISKVIPAITSVLSNYSVSSGKSLAYYFDGNGELIAHVSDEKEVDSVTYELKQLLLKYIPENHLKVKVLPCIPEMVLSCGGVGNELNVGIQKQVIGLYVQYDGQSTIYWVSTAHGVYLSLHPESASQQQCNTNELKATTMQMHEQNEPRVSYRISSGSSLYEVDVPAPYLAHSYNGSPLRNYPQPSDYDDALSATEPLSKPTLFHVVDIMLGTTPLTIWHVNGSLCLKHPLTSASNGRGDLQVSSNGSRERDQIRGVRQFDVIKYGNTWTFDTSVLQGRVLHCYVQDEDNLLKGVVTTYTYSQSISIGNINGFAQNMICIAPSEGSCAPKRGHSGSVWTMQEDGKCQAVAITCAVVIYKDTQGREWIHEWLATPLCACLMALCDEYPKRFPDYTKFSVPK